MTSGEFVRAERSMTFDRFDDPLIGIKTTPTRTASGVWWGGTVLFPGEDVLAIHRAQNSCWVYYATPTDVKKFDHCLNAGATSSPLRTTALPGATAIAVLPSGRVLVALSSIIQLFEPDGALIWSLPIAGAIGIAVDEDLTFWAVTSDSLERWSTLVPPVGPVTPIESLSYAGSTFAPKTLAVNYTFPPKPVIYLHGVKTPVNNPGDFSEVLNDSVIAPSVRRFAWYQDTNPEACAARPQLTPSATSPAMALWPAGPAGCDSQSDIGLNVLLLHQDVQEAYVETGSRVILVGYSTGAAIIRGFLAYSMGLNDGVATTMVDSVFFVAGALDGSPGAACRIGTQLCEPLGIPHEVIEAIVDTGFVTERPTVNQLAPKSSWYAWANSPAFSLPSNIGYYEAHANQRVVQVHEFIFKRWKTVFWEAGDGILPPGTNDPFDLPNRGGARFARENTAEQWQWQMCNVDWVYHVNIFGVDIDPIDQAGQQTGQIAAAVSSVLDINNPCFHSAIPKSLNSIPVEDCRTGAEISLGEQLRRVVSAKINGSSNWCYP